MNLGDVVEADILDAALAQFMGQDAGSPFSVAIDGRESDDDAFLFRYVFSPVEVFVDDILNRSRRAEYEAWSGQMKSIGRPDVFLRTLTTCGPYLPTMLT